MKRTSGSNYFGISPKAKVSRREPSEVVTRIEIVPWSGPERFEAGSVAWRKLQLFSSRFISAVSLADAAAESKDHEKRPFSKRVCSDCRKSTPYGRTISPTDHPSARREHHPDPWRGGSDGGKASRRRHAPLAVPMTMMWCCELRLQGKVEQVKKQGKSPAIVDRFQCASR